MNPTQHKPVGKRSRQQQGESLQHKHARATCSQTPHSPVPSTSRDEDKGQQTMETTLSSTVQVTSKADSNTKPQCSDSTTKDTSPKTGPLDPEWSPGESVRKYVCPVCDEFSKNFKYPHVLEHHMLKDHRTCEVCNKTFHRKHLAEHMGTHQQASGTATCSYTSLDFDINTEEGSNVGEAFQSFSSHAKSASPFSCQVCGDTFPTRKSLKIHQRQHDEQTDEGPYKRDKSAHRLYRHQRQKHSEQSRSVTSSEQTQQVKCLEGSNARPSQSVVSMQTATTSHSSYDIDADAMNLDSGNTDILLQGTNGEKRYKCTYPSCSREYRSRRALWRHEQVHENKRKHKCDQCGNTFNKKNRLQEHIETHGEKTYECDQCTKSLKSKKSLEEHMKMHGEKTYECDHCQKMFNTKNQLKYHMQTHREDVYECDQCDKIFNIKACLRQHMHTHSGEKYACDQCEKKYSQKRSLKEHIQTHGKERYACDQCQKMFSSKVSFSKHKKDYANENLYECDQCQKRFNRRFSLDQHKKTHKKDSSSGRELADFSDS